MSEIGSSAPTRVKTWRIQILLYGLVVLAIVIFGWTISFQFLPEGEELTQEGDLYQGVWLEISPPRGPIYDRSGYLLAGNKIVYEVGLELQYKGTPEAIAQVLNATIGIDYALALQIANIPYSEDAVYAQIARDVSSEDAHELMNLLAEWQANYSGGKDEDSLEGVVLFPYLARTYPEKDLAFNVIGFVAKDDNGYHGLEQRYDSVLAGDTVEVFVPKNPNYASELPDVPAGSTMILTIDREIQHMVETVLDEAVEEYDAISANAIVMDPVTGEILSMATTPRLNINEYWDFSDVFPDSTPFNRLVSYTYEPGSVFKIFTMAAAIDSENVTLDTTFFDAGYFEYGGIVVRNWDRSAWGQQNMIGCLQHSLNVCLAWVGTEMGADDFYQYMDSFGFGHYTSIDLAGEATGRLKEPGDGDWYPSDLATNTFGQGVSVTALQVITAAGAFANEGQMMVPHVIKAIVDNGVQLDVRPSVYGNPISAETAATMTYALTLSLENEASSALVPGYRVAGKTGTAQIPGGEGYLEEKTNASFIGWGPVDDPQFVIYVWLEQPTPIWGSETAAPVFSEIAQRLVVLMKIPPDNVREQFTANN
ncbi:penicillin-binding protein 2 [bacterium]|nr:penicillin-binding protein 2 [bacterium]MCB2179354.1 penicillin-binding protein 2 [bacterium]